MKVCDKCLKKAELLKEYQFGGVKVELCAVCINHIKQWVVKGEEKKMFEGIF